LETKLSNINTKKLELECEVDPLFKKTTATFDEGGARGLLLNHLSVYNGCQIAFDSNSVTSQKEEQVEQKGVPSNIIKDEYNLELDLSDLRSTLSLNCGNDINNLQNLEICPLLCEFRNMIQKLQMGEDLTKKSKSNEDSESDNEIEEDITQIEKSIDEVKGNDNSKIINESNELEQAIAMEEKIFKEKKHHKVLK